MKWIVLFPFAPFVWGWRMAKKVEYDESKGVVNFLVGRCIVFAAFVMVPYMIFFGAIGAAMKFFFDMDLGI